MLHHCFTQPTKWTKKQMDWLTCGPVGRSLSKALDLHSTTGILLQSLIFFPQRCRDRLLQPPVSSGLFCVSCSETLPRRRPGHPSTPHLLLFSTECRPTPHPNQSSFPLLSVCDSTAASSPSPGRSSLGPRRRPPPRCARRGMVNIRESSEEDCTWRA